MIAQKRSPGILACLVALLLISLPWQARFLLPGDFTYSFGLFHEYVTYFIYGSDLLFALTLFWWGVELSRGQRRLYLPPPLVLLAIGGLFLSSLATIGHAAAPLLVVYKTIKLIEFALFFLLISNKIISVGAMAAWLGVGVGFQAMIGTIQFFQQGSLGLRWLGEIFLRPSLPGVAKLSTASGVVMRAYGTLPHPNVLAGFLVIAFLTSLFFLFKPEKYLTALTSAVFLPALLFTFSRQAWLSLILALLVILILWRKRIGQLIKAQDWLLALPAVLTLLVSFSLVYPLVGIRLDPQHLPQEEALQERWDGVAASLQLLARNNTWLIGSGPGHFTLATAQTLQQDLYPWERQPVHNIFLLVWSEQGILGLISLLLLFSAALAAIWHKSAKQPRELSYLLTIMVAILFALGLFDHYLWDLQSGQLLFWLTLGLVIASLRKKAAAELTQPILPVLPTFTWLTLAPATIKSAAHHHTPAAHTATHHAKTALHSPAHSHTTAHAKPAHTKHKKKKKRRR